MSNDGITNYCPLCVKLEVENRRLVQAIKAGGDVSKRGWARIQELEAENQRLREALESISNLYKPDITTAGNIAKAALLEE